MTSRPSSSSHQETPYDSQNLADSGASLKLLLDAIRDLTTDVHEMQQHQQDIIDEIRRLSDTVHTLDDRIASGHVRREGSFTIPNDSVSTSPPPVAPVEALPNHTTLPTIPPLVVENPPTAGSSTNPAPGSTTAAPSARRRPRRLAPEDSFRHKPAAANELRPHQLAREDAFYHISNAHTYPFKAPNGGVHPAHTSSTAAPSSLRKRRTPTADDVKEEEAHGAFGSPSTERPAKKQRARGRGGQKADTQVSRQLPGRR